MNPLEILSYQQYLGPKGITSYHQSTLNKGEMPIL